MELGSRSACILHESKRMKERKERKEKKEEKKRALTMKTNGLSCASYNTKTGRWTAEDCGRVSHFFACRSNSNMSAWTVGTMSSTRYYRGSENIDNEEEARVGKR